MGCFYARRHNDYAYSYDVVGNARHIWEEVMETINKLHYWAERGLFNVEALHSVADEMQRLRDALQSIADIEHENIHAPTTPAEANLWGIIDGCVRVAEKALKEKE